MTDYCTAWPDGWPTWLGGTGDEWRHCCKLHDAAYTHTMTWTGKLVADYHLATCVGGIMGAVMWTGVATFGALIAIHLTNRYGRVK